MATEAPLLHHSQCIAGENMSSTAGLNGFNGTGQFLVAVTTATARSLIHGVNSTAVPAGIIQNDPISGFTIDIGFMGISKAINGTAGALAAGITVMCETNATPSGGRIIAFATPGTNYPVGYTLEAATAVNQVVTMMVMPLSL
jgi:hypothetical protein